MMTSYLMRLDDACEKRNMEAWDRIEQLLDQYGVKPLVGVIPHCEDPTMEAYPEDPHFWERVKAWERKGWMIALHGYDHVYITRCGGLNPVNPRSEFAGVPLEHQKQKISDGLQIMRAHGIVPRVFFAPSHTFDGNTLTALRECSAIRILSDTVANDVYTKDGFTFVPQQTGSVRALPLKTVTFCYHPNVMDDATFERLEAFLARRHAAFKRFPVDERDSQGLTAYDRLLQKAYWAIRRLRGIR